MDLSLLNGKRIVVELVSGDRLDVICGIGEYEHQHRCGSVLRIQLDEQRRVGVVAFVLDEGKWNGDIWEDSRHGCEYGLRLERERENWNLEQVDDRCGF